MKNKPAFFLRLVTWVVKQFFNLLCQIDTSQLDRIPQQGPLIIVGNHINFIDSPVIFSNLFPRPVTGFAKSETWEKPFLGWLFSLWDFIPIHRGEADRKAFTAALQALEDRKIVAVAPEGTRSKDGLLGKGHPGIILLAVKSGVPVLPVAIHGIEGFHQNIRRLKKTPFHIEVGTPFRIDTKGQALSREVREEITTQIMLRLAELLPEKYHGVYSNMDDPEVSYLVNIF